MRRAMNCSDCAVPCLHALEHVSIMARPHHRILPEILHNMIDSRGQLLVFFIVHNIEHMF